MSLAELRADLDSIDDRIADLLAERESVLRRVVVEKRRGGHAAHDPLRERAILERVQARGPYTLLVFEQIVRLGREFVSATLSAEGEQGAAPPPPPQR